MAVKEILVVLLVSAAGWCLAWIYCGARSVSEMNSEFERSAKSADASWSDTTSDVDSSFLRE